MLVPVAFVLAARPGTRLDDVARLSAHPHAWAQCRRWLRANLPDVVHVPATSNTAPAALLAGTTEKLAFEAALIPPAALQHYGLDVLAEDVADNGTAVTRFVLVGPPGSLPEPTGADKTTLVVHLPSDQPGALLEMLEQFATRGSTCAGSSPGRSATPSAGTRSRSTARGTSPTNGSPTP